MIKMRKIFAAPVGGTILSKRNSREFLPLCKITRLIFGAIFMRLCSK